MTKVALPFSNSPIADDIMWRRMARLWLGTGVIPPAHVSVPVYATALLVFGDASGLNVKVSPGEAYVDGGYFAQDTQQTLPINGPDPSNSRIDRVVLRWDGPNNTADYAVLQGTPAVTPTPPAVTQNQGGRWEVALADVRVNGGVTNIAAGVVTDIRPLAAPRSDTPLPACRAFNSTQIVCASGAVTTLPFDSESWDTHGFHDLSVNTGRLTVPPKLGGLYLVGLTLQWDTNPNGSRRGAMLRKNNALIGGMETAPASGTYPTFSPSSVIKAVPGDYFDAYGFQDCGGALGIVRGASYSPELYCVRLGD